MASQSEQTIPKTLYSSLDLKLNKLTQEGYNHRFVDLDKSDNLSGVIDVECVFCCMVIRNTVQISACGHSFCSTCWGDWHGLSGDQVRCPMDNEIVDVTGVFQDRKNDRLIRSLKVYCDNKDFGCQVTPELRNLQTHLEKCEYQTVNCELMCGKKVLLWSLADHMKLDCSRRILSCDVCSIELLAEELQVHIDACPMKLMNCDLCLETNILLKDLSDHKRTRCPKFVTFCNFALIGCSNKIVRENLSSHHESHTKDHLRLLNSAVTHLYHDVGSLYPAANKDMSQDDDLRHELPPALWGKVTEDRSDATVVEWSQLPECVNVGDNANHRSLFDSVANLVESTTQDSKKIEELSCEVERLSKVNQESEMEIKRLSESHSEFKEEMTKLTKNDSRHKNEIARLSKEVLDSNGKVAELSMKIVDVERNFADVRVENCNLARELNRVCIVTDQVILDSRKAMNAFEIKKELFLDLNSDQYPPLCPCMWTVNMYKTSTVQSPLFYTNDGYHILFVLQYDKELTPNTIIYIVIANGENDDKLEWPWAGDKGEFIKSLTVVDARTNQELPLCDQTFHDLQKSQLSESIVYRITKGKLEVRSQRIPRGVYVYAESPGFYSCGFNMMYPLKKLILFKK